MKNIQKRNERRSVVKSIQSLQTREEIENREIKNSKKKFPKSFRPLRGRHKLPKGSNNTSSSRL